MRKWKNRNYSIGQFSILVENRPILFNRAENLPIQNLEKEPLNQIQCFRQNVVFIEAKKKNYQLL